MKSKCPKLMNFYKLMEFLFNPLKKDTEEEKQLRSKFFESESSI